MAIHSHVIPLVALVGFSGALTTYSRGLFQRCGLSILECEGIDKAVRIVRTLALDALVLNGRDEHLRTPSPDLLCLLSAHARATTATNNRIPLLVLRSSQLSTEALAVYRACGAIIVPERRQRYRYLARLVLRLSGCSASCCETGLSDGL